MKDEGCKVCITPLILGPASVSDIYSQHLFSADTSRGEEFTDNVLKFTCQMPKDVHVIQAPAVLYINSGGIVFCFDPSIHEWLSYVPRPRQTSSSLKCVTEATMDVALDSTLAQATFPVLVKKSQKSDSEYGSMPFPVNSSTASLPTAAPGVSSTKFELLTTTESVSNAAVHDVSKRKSFASKLAKLFPYLKIVDLQIEIGSVCVFLPQNHVCCGDPVTDIRLAFQKLYQAHHLPDTLVVCFPSINISSSGRKQTPIQQIIPLRSVEQSLAADKLPWHIKLLDCSVYTIHKSEVILHVLKPTSVSGTLAVNGKYFHPTGPFDSISELNWCFHADMSPASMACSKAQIHLFYYLFRDILQSSTQCGGTLLLVCVQKATFESSDVLDIERSKVVSYSATTISINKQDAHKFPVKISESSERMKSEILSDKDVISESRVREVKVTLWLQFTLPKLIIKSFGFDKKCSEAMYALAHLEDLTLSLDVSDVYSKLRCMIGGIHVCHFCYKKGIKNVGNMGGFLVSSTNLLKKNTRMMVPTSFVSEKMSYTDANKSEQDSGFASVTFTQALTSNVQQKFESLSDGSVLSGSELGMAAGSTYLTEICCSFQPVDIILNGSVISSLLDIVSVPDRRNDNCNVEDCSDANQEASEGYLPLVSARSLPLLYVNCSGCRLFLPSSAESVEDTSASPEHDLCVVQISSLTVTPHANNPLPRIVVNDDLNARELFCEMSKMPGSVVEDRQYQMALCGLSVATGNWQQFLSQELRTTSFRAHSFGQNPALEWNLASGGTETFEEVLLVPILAGFDLLTTFAPPIVSGRAGVETVVCGYSVEVNATSDINVSLCIRQLKLLSIINETNLGNLTRCSHTDAASSAHQQSCDFVHESRPHDSGIGVKLSTVGNQVDPNFLMNSFVCAPYNMLFTARKVSVMLYSHELNAATVVAENLHAYTTVPFMYSYMLQPHLVTKSYGHCKEVEFSVHDCIAKGSLSDSSRKNEGYEVIPDACDFPVCWIETRSGIPDLYTGLLPNLFTVKIILNNGNIESMDVALERPLKLIGSVNKLQLLKTFADQLMSLSAKSKMPEELEEEGPSKHSALTVREIHMRTTQLVLCFDMPVMLEAQRSIAQACSIQLALVGMRISGNLEKANGHIKKACSHAVLQNVTLKSARSGNFESILSPVTTEFSFIASSVLHSGTVGSPKINASLKCGCIQIQLGQNAFQSLELIHSHITDYMYESHVSSPTVGKVPKGVHNTSGFQQSEIDSSESVDDLKSGCFAYRSEDCGSSTTNAGEIVFHTDHAKGFATMTWCYAESRIITKFCVSPVPYYMPQINQATNEIGDDLKVECILQFACSLDEHFEDYAVFNLSQNCSYDVKIPVLSGDDPAGVVSAELWRIFMRYPKSAERDVCIPVVSPRILAASVLINSIFLVQHVPVVRFTINVSCLRFRLLSNVSQSSNLGQYKLLKSVQNFEVLVFTMHDSSVNVCGLRPNVSKLLVKFKSQVACDVLQFRSLTMWPLLKRCNANMKLELIRRSGHTRLSIETIFDKVRIQAGQSAVWTLNYIVNTWNISKDVVVQSDPIAYYVICNDTQENVHIGQMATDEVILVPSRCAVQYHWRTQKSEQLLKIVPDSVELLKGHAMNIDQDGVVAFSLVRSNGKQISLIVKVQTLSNVQKQVVVCGVMRVCNLLSHSLEVKLATAHFPSGSSCIALPNECLSSYILDHSSDQATLKVKQVGLEAAWSQDISVSASQSGQLVRLQSAGRKEVLHVWCHSIQKNHGLVTEHALIFSPLFVMKTQLPIPLLVNIESSSPKACLQLCLDGRGVEKQLELFGGGNAVYHLTFQLGPKMQVSSPAVCLAADTIDQVNRQTVKHPDLLSLCKKLCESLDSEIWPYNLLDSDESGLAISENSSFTDAHATVSSSSMSATDIMPDFEQPNISLQVNLHQRWPYLNTLLIDIVPSWLFVNQICFDVILTERNGSSWRIPAGKTFAPNNLNDAISVGVVINGSVYCASWITLSDEDDKMRYLPRYDDLLYRESHLQVTVPITHDSVLIQLCCLTIHSVVSHEMRIITVRERFSLCSTLTCSLEVSCASVQLDDTVQKLSIPEESYATVILKRTSTSTDAIHPLLLWNVLGHRQSSTTASSTLLSHVQYIRLRYADDKCKCDSDSKSNSLKTQWSYPVKVNATDVGRRLSVVIPAEKLSTTACNLIAKADKALTYLILSEDLLPYMLLHNNCVETLYFGQAVVESSHADIVIAEQLEQISNIPRVDSKTSRHYNPPIFNEQFPNINSGALVPKLRLGAMSDSKDIHWSHSIDLQAENCIFIGIPELFDVQITVRKLGHTMHIYIDPVSRAEISAKEVRSRISNKITVEKKPKVETTLRTRSDLATSKATRENSATESQSAKAETAVPSTDSKSPTGYQDKPTGAIEAKDGMYMSVCVQVFSDKIAFVLFDETSSFSVFSEFLRITVDQAAVSFYPTLDIHNSTSNCLMHTHNIVVSFFDMQVDNQLYGYACYDFPVILAKQPTTELNDHLKEIHNFTLMEKISYFQSRSFLCLSVELCSGNSNSQLSLQRLHLCMKPVKLFVEDSFAWDLLKIIDKIIPTWSICTTFVCYSPGSLNLPLRIKFSYYSLSAPLRIEHLCIEPISALVSFRATLKVFVATNGAPLMFGRFELRNVSTTSQQLVKALTIHYASAALFRAGLVVGSLEILGNPTGFVRHIGDGVADMFCMPYRGLTVGPGAFLSGITKGMASITRHLSMGTLTSITNFASSVSRNMENLSLDSEHIHRNELIRRRSPSGLSDGLKNGLTGLGLSLLGAIAGIADQPLQAFTRNQSEATSAKSQAKSIMMGLGKGLVGIVTKPIGGAAEFVSQTSLGILNEVGLKDSALPRHKPSNKLLSMYNNGSAKYIEKMIRLLTDLSYEAVVFVYTNVQTTSPHIPSICVLVLTTGYLLFVSVEDDELILTLPIAEIDCFRLGSCAVVVKLRQRIERNLVETQNARVTAFIENSMATVAHSELYTRRSDHDSFVGISTKSQTESVLSIESQRLLQNSDYNFLFVQPSEADLFCCLFDMLHNSVFKRGFAS